MTEQEEKKDQGSILRPQEYVTLYDKDGGEHKCLHVDARELVVLSGFTRIPPGGKEVVVEKGTPRKQKLAEDRNAKEVIALIRSCTTVEQVQELLEGETRVSVKNAAETKISELEDEA